MQYFCPNGLGDSTLAESFGKVPFHYQICNHGYENATFTRYVELVNNYERTKGALTESQHLQLIQILEKRLGKGSQIQQDYFASKARSKPPPQTWYKTMLRIGEVLNATRVMINQVKCYGNPDIPYKHPPGSKPPKLKGSKGDSGSTTAPSNTSQLTVRDPSTYKATLQTQSRGLEIREPAPVPVVPIIRACRSCGETSHLLIEKGFGTWQELFVLPGYEIQVQYFFPGSKPFLMCNDHKRVKNAHGSTLDSNTQANQDQGNQGNPSQGCQNQGKGVQFQNNNSNPGRGKGYQGNKYNPPSNQGENLVHYNLPVGINVEVCVDSISY